MGARDRVSRDSLSRSVAALYLVTDRIEALKHLPMIFHETETSTGLRKFCHLHLSRGHSFLIFFSLPILPYFK